MSILPVFGCPDKGLSAFSYVKQVRDFLVAEGQWSEDLPANPEFAMWMVATQCGPFYIFSRMTHFSH